MDDKKNEKIVCENTDTDAEITQNNKKPRIGKKLKIFLVILLIVVNI